MKERATSSDPYSQATLLSLPPELRDEIYAYLLASGDLSIVRSSRQLSVETLRLIYTGAMLRFYVNSAEACRNIQPGENAAERIQNLRLHWHLSDFDCHRNAHDVIRFCQNKQKKTRMTCHVILKFGAWRAALLNANDIAALRNLRVFRNVILETTVVKDSTQVLSSGVLAKLRSRTLRMLKVLGDVLGIALGPADHRGDPDGRYLVFHPSSMSETLFHELPPSDRAYSW